MSKPRASQPRDSYIVGLKYFDRLMPLLQRQLFFDHYCAYILLFLFNPVVDSLRGIQQASELKKVQKKLGCPRASLGSLSEAVVTASVRCCALAVRGRTLSPTKATPRRRREPLALALLRRFPLQQ
jgi:hypothetical protein